MTDDHPRSDGQASADVHPGFRALVEKLQEETGRPIPLQGTVTVSSEVFKRYFEAGPWALPASEAPEAEIERLRAVLEGLFADAPNLRRGAAPGDRVRVYNGRLQYLPEEFHEMVYGPEGS